MRLAGALLLAAVAVAPAAAQQDEREGQRRANVGEAIRRMFPSDRDLDELLRGYDTERRKSERYDEPQSYKAPQRRTINVSFRRGEIDPIIHTAVNRATVLSFFDSTGNPWPVSIKSSTNPVSDERTKGQFGGFDAEIIEEGGNSVQITSIRPYGFGTLMVYLKGAPMPVAFQLQQGEPVFDSVTRVHVAERGPNAPANVYVQPNQIVTGAGHMTDMLAGITPAGAKPLRVAGANADQVRGWRMGDSLYVVSQARPYAPRPTAYQFAEGGWQVFAVPAPRRGPVSIMLTNGLENFPVTFTE